MTRAVDVVVVGGGVIGGAIAYELTRHGCDVLLIERAMTPAGATASGANAGGVRQQGRTAAELPIAMRAVQLWGTLSERLEYDVEYRQSGMTTLTDDPDRIPELEARVELERDMGLAIRMVYGDDLHRLIPGLNPAMVGGTYCPTDGSANPMRATKGFTLAVQRSGAQVWPGTTVTGFAARDGQVMQVRTDRGPVACRQVVLAAGVWTAELAAMLGTALPIRNGPLQMMVTERLPQALDQTLSWAGHAISLKQAPSGGFVIGGGWPGQGDLSGRNQTLHGSMVQSARVAVSLLPALRDVALVRAWVGLEAYCPDEMPIIGPLPGYANVLVAAGLSGHGFCLAPAIGELVARGIRENRLDPLLAPFAAERFRN